MSRACEPPSPQLSLNWRGQCESEFRVQSYADLHLARRRRASGDATGLMGSKQGRTPGSLTRVVAAQPFVADWAVMNGGSSWGCVSTTRDFCGERQIWMRCVVGVRGSRKKRHLQPARHTCRMRRRSPFMLHSRCVGRSNPILEPSISSCSKAGAMPSLEQVPCRPFLRGPQETLAGAPINAANFVVMGTANSGFVPGVAGPRPQTRVDVSTTRVCLRQNNDGRNGACFEPHGQPKVHRTGRRQSATTGFCFLADAILRD